MIIVHAFVVEMRPRWSQRSRVRGLELSRTATDYPVSKYDDALEGDFAGKSAEFLRGFFGEISRGNLPEFFRPPPVREPVAAGCILSEM